MHMGVAIFPISKSLLPKSIGFGSTRAERDDAFAKGGQGIPDERYVITGYSRLLKNTDYAVTEKKALVWDTAADQFIYRTETFSRKFAENRLDITSEELTIPGNTMWDDGVFVDQKNKRLILPDGRWIDGPTGDLYSVHGEPFSVAHNTLNKEV